MKIPYKAPTELTWAELETQVSHIDCVRFEIMARCQQKRRAATRNEKTVLSTLLTMNRGFLRELGKRSAEKRFA
jgi:hypothetical protein